MASTKNLKVLGRMYGSYNRGAVIPRWCAADYGEEGITRLVAEGILAETDERVNVEVKPRESVVKELDSTTALVVEGNELRKENDRLKNACDGFEAQVKDQTKLIEAYRKTLGEQTAEISRLQGLLEEARNAPIVTGTFDPTDPSTFSNVAKSFNDPLPLGPIGSGLAAFDAIEAAPPERPLTDEELEALTRPTQPPGLPAKV